MADAKRSSERITDQPGRESHQESAVKAVGITWLTCAGFRARLRVGVASIRQNTTYLAALGFTKMSALVMPNNPLLNGR